MTPLSYFVSHGVYNLSKVFVGGDLSRCQREREIEIHSLAIELAVAAQR